MTYNITRTNGFNLVDLDENIIDILMVVNGYLCHQKK